MNKACDKGLEFRGIKSLIYFRLQTEEAAAGGAIKAFKKGVLYHGIDCNRGPKTDPPILEPAFLLVNR